MTNLKGTNDLNEIKELRANKIKKLDTELVNNLIHTRNGLVWSINKTVDFIEFLDNGLYIEMDLYNEKLIIRDEWDDVLISKLGSWDNFSLDEETLQEMDLRKSQLAYKLYEYFVAYHDINMYVNKLHDNQLWIY